MGAQFVPYMEPSFWKGLPKAKAEEFARFLKFVTQGSPLMTNMVVEPSNYGVPEYQAAPQAPADGGPGTQPRRRETEDALGAPSRQ